MTQAINYAYNEYPCSKTVNGDSFPGGIQEYAFSVGGQRVFIPSRSYFEMDVSLYVYNAASGTKAAGLYAPSILDDITFAEDAANMAYSQARFQAASNDISVTDNLTQQVAGLHNRSAKSSAWQHTIGAGAFALTSNRTHRAIQTSQWAFPKSDGPTTVGVPSIKVMGTQRGLEQFDCACSPYVDGSSISDYGTISMTTAGLVTGYGTNFTKDLVGATLYVYKQTQANIGAPDAKAGIPIGIVQTVATPTSCKLVDNGANYPEIAVNAKLTFVFLKHTLASSEQTKNSTRILFQPQLSIFDYDGYLSGGKYAFWLTPDQNYKFNMVESGKQWQLYNSVTPRVNQFQVVVNNVRFYACTADLVGRLPDPVIKLDLWEYFAQMQPMNSRTQVFTVQVPPSTIAIHCFLQTNRVGTNTIIPPNRFKTYNGSELSLRTIRVTYGNKTNPPTEWNSEFTVSDGNSVLNVDQYNNTNQISTLQQWYMQRNLETGKDKSLGGVESFNEWLERGPIYTFSFDRDFTDRATQAVINVQYDGGVNGTDGDAGSGRNQREFDINTNFFIVAQYRKAAEIISENGSIVRVRIADT